MSSGEFSLWIYVVQLTSLVAYAPLSASLKKMRITNTFIVNQSTVQWYNPNEVWQHRLKQMASPFCVHILSITTTYSALSSEALMSRILEDVSLALELHAEDVNTWAQDTKREQQPKDACMQTKQQAGESQARLFWRLRFLQRHQFTTLSYMCCKNKSICLSAEVQRQPRPDLHHT